MIQEIRIENMFSIFEEVTLDFRAANIPTKRARLLSDNIIVRGTDKILKTIVIYGANASGKSNLFKAIRGCIEMILQSSNYNEDTKFPFKSFKFGGKNKPSSFYINFFIEGVEYEYAFSATEVEILSESLYYYPKGRKNIVFERETSSYKFRSAINRPLDVVSNTSKKTLFLTRGSQMNREVLKSVYKFFSNDIVILKSSDLSSLLSDITPEEKAQFLNVLNIADSDIENFSIEDGKIRTVHKNNPDIGFDFRSEESDGTIRLFDIALNVISVLKDGKAIFIDELENSLHVKLMNFIVNSFNHNEAGAQLVFSSHNTYFLNLDRMRKDQIYFTRKKDDGSTEVYSLYDFKDLNENTDMEVAYRQGVFDAIPYLSADYIR